MGRKPNSQKVTSKKVASIASGMLRNPKSSAASKKVAGSALGQTPSKRGKKR